MRFHRISLPVCLLMAIAGCKSNLESVPEAAPPETAPTVPSSAALRPNYHFAGKPAVAAGTGFAIADKAGKPYLLTAAHVMDNDAEWQQVRDVSLRVMGGDVIAGVQGRPRYVGKAFTDADAGVDLVIWPLAEGASIPTLKLAASDAKKNEWVWAIGQEPGSSGPQKAYRCKVTGTERGGLLLQQYDRFEMRGFSGGPIVNAQAEVIGSLLGGRAPTLIASKVSSIRARLAGAGVDVP